MQLAWTDRHLQYWASKSGVNLNCGNAKDDWKDEERYSSFEERCVNSQGQKTCSPGRYFNGGIGTSCLCFPSLHPQRSRVRSSNCDAILS